MLFSLKLLEKYTGFKLDVKDLATKVNAHAFEVEGIEEYNLATEGVITAKVVKIEQHPNADRLRIATLKTNNKTISPVVCGGSNLAVGQIVALAMPGSVIPRSLKSSDKVVLERSEIRGITSEGMLCGSYELGLTNDSTSRTIALFPKTTRLGVDIKELLHDHVIDISITANRKDCMSHLGMAREICAIYGKQFKFKAPSFKLNTSSKHIKFKTVSKKASGAFHIALFEVGEMNDLEPEISARLAAIGIRAVNPIVDLTNLLTFELGRPLHAFDADKISGHLQVRFARPGEKITLLNHKTYELDKDVLVVADDKVALDIAGVMGGIDSEVGPTTRRILMIAGHFDGPLVRHAWKKYSIQSSAPKYQEKGIDEVLSPQSFAEFFDYLGRTNDFRLIDAVGLNRSEPKSIKVKTNLADINNFLGSNYSWSHVKRVLQNLQMNVSGNAKSFTVIPPTFRDDIHNTFDVAEEIVRINGLEKLTPQPYLTSSYLAGKDEIFEIITAVQNGLAQLGLKEVKTYSLVSAKEIANVGGSLTNHIKLANPVSEEHVYLRTDLEIGGLRSLVNGGSGIYFETGKTFSRTRVRKKSLRYAIPGIDQRDDLGIIAGFPDMTSSQVFLTLKGKCSTLFEHLGVNYKFVPLENSLAIEFDGEVGGGIINLLPKKTTNNFKINYPVAYASIDLNSIAAATKNFKYKPENKFPSVKRDISVILDLDHSWQSIEKLIMDMALDDLANLGAKLVEQPEEFVSKLREKGRKNLILNLEFNSKSRSLTEAEVTAQMDQILLKLKQEGIEIR